MNTRPKAIIFDYDGVLVDSLAVGIEAYREIARQLGITGFSSEEEFKHAHIKPYHEIYQEWKLAPREIVKATEIYYDIKRKRKGEIALIPGIREVLEKLAGSYRLAVASGMSREIIEERLKSLGVRQHFECVIGKEDGKKSESLGIALQRLSVSPEEALFVGDMVQDTIIGKAAQVKTVILCSHSWNRKEALQDAQPDVLIERPEQLLGVLA